MKIASVDPSSSVHAVICDFGLARNITESMTMGTLGTSVYIAPELLNSQSYDQKADVIEIVIDSY